jgi:hypothetical protein
VALLGPVHLYWRGSEAMQGRSGGPASRVGAADLGAGSPLPRGAMGSTAWLEPRKAGGCRSGEAGGR